MKKLMILTSLMLISAMLEHMHVISNPQARKFTPNLQEYSYSLQLTGGDGDKNRRADYLIGLVETGSNDFVESEFTTLYSYDLKDLNTYESQLNDENSFVSDLAAAYKKAGLKF